MQIDQPVGEGLLHGLLQHLRGIVDGHAVEVAERARGPAAVMAAEGIDQEAELRGQAAQPGLFREGRRGRLLPAHPVAVLGQGDPLPGAWFPALMNDDQARTIG